jgi:hypothetical protein
MLTRLRRASTWASGGGSDRRCGAPSAAAPALAIVALLTAGGCAARPGPLFQPGATAPRWPPPPDSPHILYLGQVASDRDLKPGRSALQSVGRSLFGEEPAREMVSPMGVCTDGSERLFVADSASQVVHVFDLAARRYSRWSPPEKVSRFLHPVAVAWDPGRSGLAGARAPRLLVCDSLACVIFAFRSDGVFAGELGRGVLKRPCGLAIDATGRILVADAEAHQIVVLSTDGLELRRLGSRGTGLGQFNYPTNLAMDIAGRLYVSDSLNFRVQVFEPDLTPLRQIGSKGDLPGYFSNPKGITIDSEGHVYVIDANFEAVQLFDGEGQLLMTFGGEGRGPGQFWLPAGLHADPRGRIWVADSYNRRVQVFQYLAEGATP